MSTIDINNGSDQSVSWLERFALHYLVDPYLPSRCVVGFFGRGSVAKSSFVATLGADISDRASTLWISVEERSDWARSSQTRSGGRGRTGGTIPCGSSEAHSTGRTAPRWGATAPRSPLLLGQPPVAATAPAQRPAPMWPSRPNRRQANTLFERRNAADNVN